uniref:Soluble lamin-associated protein of 75 kDa isoform X1 n=1 Tax=Petromyzon marinus TaxID=7757 RepID=A0AAJ7T2X0_PETMA|nr:soluble lamin-associated protein of 75 kDa isoform X1 [Petromyzon marinus]
MQFPVDFLVDTSHEVLERTAISYLDNLLHCHPNNPEFFKLPNGCKVPITATSVSFVLLYGASSQHKLLALFSPEDAFTAVAFYLDDEWWAVEEILKTADPTRNGIIQVQSVGERLVLYTLNRLVYRTREMDAAEWTFLCHSPTEHAKLLWQDGEAVGFYSVKPTGSLCTSFVSLHYKLPVLDSMFVTRRCRGQGLGLLMLQDFTQSFPDDQLGLKYPLPPTMCRVVERYLQQYPNELDLLWEVQAPGDPYQRVNVWKKLQSTPVPQQKPRRENRTAIADAPVERQSVAIQTSTEEVMQAHAPPSNAGEQLLQSDADEELPGDDIGKQPPSSNEESSISNGADEVTAVYRGDLPTEDKEVVVKDDETPILVEDEEQLPTDDNKKLTPLADDTDNDPPMKNIAEEMPSEDEEKVNMEEAEEEPPMSDGDAKPLNTPEHNCQEGSPLGYSIPVMVIQDEDGNMLSEEEEDEESTSTTQKSATRSNPAQSVDSGIEETPIGIKERDVKHKRLHSEELFVCLSEVLAGQESPKNSSNAGRKLKRMKLEQKDENNQQVEIEIHTSHVVVVDDSEEEEEEDPSDIVAAEAAAVTENDEGSAAAPGVETDNVEGDGVQGDTSNAAVHVSGADEAAAEQDNGEKKVVSTPSSQTLANENIDTSVAANVPPPTPEQSQQDSALSSVEEDPTQKETSEADAEEQISTTEEAQVANEATPTNTDAASDTPVKENIVKKKAKAGEMSSPLVALQKPNTRNKFKNTRSSKKRGMLE